MFDDPQLAVPKSELEMATLELAMYKLMVEEPVLSMTEVCKSWMDQVTGKQDEDMLVVGFKDGENPFKEIKGGCIIL